MVWEAQMSTREGSKEFSSSISEHGAETGLLTSIVDNVRWTETQCLIPGLVCAGILLLLQTKFGY